MTEANFGNVQSWTTLNPVMSLASDLGVLSEEQCERFSKVLQALATYELSNNYQGFDLLSADLQQQSVDKHLCEQGIDFEPLEIMNIFCDAGLVPSDPLWDDFPMVHRRWIDFKAACPTL